MAVFYGVDVSVYQGSITWSTLASNKSFAIIKATGGDGGFYTDSHFYTNQAGARASGIATGYYHFGSNGAENAVTEANYFSSVVGSLQTGEALFLDTETYSGSPGISPSWCLAFLNQLSANYGGYLPLIYMNESLSNNTEWNSVVSAGYQLWVADWTGSANFGLSTDWGYYPVHQYSDSGSVGGIPNTVDLDAFNAISTGTISDWGTLIGYNSGGGGGPVNPTLTQATVVSSSTPPYTKAQPIAIEIPTQKYDKVIYSNNDISFTVNQSGSSYPLAAVTETLITDIGQEAYPVGIYSYDGGTTWNDLGAYGALNLSTLIIPNTPIIEVNPNPTPNGNVLFSIVVQNPYGSSSTVTIQIKLALLAMPNASPIQIPSLTQQLSYANVSEINNYSTYRRILLEGTQTGSTLTTTPHNLSEIPVPSIWEVNPSMTGTGIVTFINTWSSDGSANSGMAVDSNNIYTVAPSADTFYYRVYKDN